MKMRKGSTLLDPPAFDEVAGGAAPQRGAVSATLNPWIQSQALNVKRHAAALRPFTSDEFGPGPAAPSDGHVQATNDLIQSLLHNLHVVTKQVSNSAALALREPSTRNLQRVVRRKEMAHNWVQAIERIWDFYFELFGQRQSQYGEWLLATDRIALDCYQAAWSGLGRARTVPAPPPFTYMRTGFSPATFRRGIPLRRLGQQINPFPLIQLPYHRMVNPWTLGAVLHEVSHNLQSDLGLSRAVPLAMARRLLKAGMGRSVAGTWTRWNRELFADVSAVLLGGPAVVGSLMDVVGRSPGAVARFSPRGPHPTPQFRVLISTELLRRMGFAAEAAGYRKTWLKIYPDPSIGTIPRKMIETFEDANAEIVDAVCYQPFAELGNKALSEVIRFEQKDQKMIEESATRLASGNDPGIIPERYLIGAARLAIDNRLASPSAIKEHFYKELVRR
jgi:hypothetical protein